MASRTNSKRAPKEAVRKSRKVCQFCKDKTEWIDYKDVNLLRKFVSDRGKIRARRVTGNCSQHQREVAVAVKTGRELALLPYTQRTSTERTGRAPRNDRRNEDQNEDVSAEGGNGDGATESTDRARDTETEA